MEQELQNTLAQRFSELPEKIQTAIQSVDLRGELKAIADERGLMIDQAGKLEDEVVLVMMGFDGTADFPENIMRALEVDERIAHSITNAVNTRIFLPIRDAMQRIEAAYGADEEEETPAEDAHKEEAVSREQALKELEDEAAEPPPVHTRKDSSNIPDSPVTPATPEKPLTPAQPPQKPQHDIPDAQATQTQSPEEGQKLPPQEKPAPPQDPYREPIE